MPEEQSQNRIIGPDDPEFKMLVEGSDAGMPMTPAKFTISDHSKFQLHHTKIPQDNRYTKLVFHVKKASKITMAELGEVLYKKLVERMNLPHPVRIFCGPSPLGEFDFAYRSQWDFIVLNVPNLNANIVYDTILTSIMNYTPGDV